MPHIIFLARDVNFFLANIVKFSLLYYFYLQVTEPGLPQTPKAVVKPQVLTHVIDGHVIKESSAPFPVSPAKGEFTFRFRFTVLFVTKNKNLFEVFSSRCI